MAARARKVEEPAEEPRLDQENEPDNIREEVAEDDAARGLHERREKHRQHAARHAYAERVRLPQELLDSERCVGQA